MEDNGLMFGRKDSKDDWSNPGRDFLQVMPSCIVRGAAYATDPNSSIYNWLTQQEGINKTNVVEKVRTGLSELLAVFNEMRTASLEEVLPAGRIEWPVMQAILFGSGIVGLNTYNVKFRQARLTDKATGSIEEPAPFIDGIHGLRIFDDLVKTMHGKTDA